MKAITIWQPWASLIAIGAKPYEFRSRRPPAALIGQRIAIHAGARDLKPKEIEYLLWQLASTPPKVCLRADLAVPFLQPLVSNPDGVWRSHIIATAVIGTPKAGDECAKEFGIEVGGNDSDRGGTFNWGWPMLEVELIQPPVPVRGAQGFWNWDGFRG